MRIENRPRSYGGAPNAVAKTGAAQAGKFRQILASAPREPKDTLAISNRAPAVEETPAGAAASDAAGVGRAAPQAAPSGSATDIQPGDSTQVKLAKLQQMAEEADYTGMSYGEIYTAIWNRYDQAFDGNWASIRWFPSIEEGNVATYYFQMEVNRNISAPLMREFKAETGINVMNWTKEQWPQHERDMRAYHEYVLSKYGNIRTQALGYGNMTMEEVEQAIYEKYKGKDTLRDFLNMQGELFHTGVMRNKLGANGAGAYWKAMEEQLTKTYFFDDYIKAPPINISQARWSAVLDGKFDAHAFASDMRESLKNTSFSGWDFDIEDAISKGIDYLLEAVERTK